MKKIEENKKSISEGKSTVSFSTNSGDWFWTRIYNSFGTPKVEDEDQAIEFITKAQKELENSDAVTGFETFRSMLNTPEDATLSDGTKKILKKFSDSLPNPNSGFKNTAARFWDKIPGMGSSPKWECDELDKDGCNLRAQAENQRLHKFASEKVRELSDHSENSDFSKLLKYNREYEEKVEKIDALYGRNVFQEFTELDAKADAKTHEYIGRRWWGSIWHYTKPILGSGLGVGGFIAGMHNGDKFGLSEKSLNAIGSAAVGICGGYVLHWILSICAPVWLATGLGWLTFGMGTFAAVLTLRG